MKRIPNEEIARSQQHWRSAFPSSAGGSRLYRSRCQEWFSCTFPTMQGMDGWLRRPLSQGQYLRFLKHRSGIQPAPLHPRNTTIILRRIQCHYYWHLLDSAECTRHLNNVDYRKRSVIPTLLCLFQEYTPTQSLPIRNVVKLRSWNTRYYSQHLVLLAPLAVSLFL